MTLPTANQTSGHYLIGVLGARAEAAGATPDDESRFHLGFDIFIKQRSYMILNKVFFWLALLTTTAVLIWPLIVALFRTEIELIGAAVAQTMITGLAAFFIYVYRHYKVRQMSAENLLRTVVFSRQPVDTLSSLVIDEMARLDQGFGFKTKTAEPGESAGDRDG